MSDAEDALKWRRLMDYYKHWPYSGYRDIENASLIATLREIAQGKDITDGSYSPPKKGVK